MNSNDTRNRFAVSQTLTTWAGAAFVAFMGIAFIVVALAQVWTCFAPRPSAEAPNRLTPIAPDSAHTGHARILASLHTLWGLSRQPDSLSILIVPSSDINAASFGAGRFLAWEGLGSLPDWAIDGVMAHEVAHDQLQHSRHISETREVLEFISGLVGLAGHADEDVDATVTSWARSAVLPHYSRQQEYQADSLGAGLLGAMSYDGPATMAAALKLLLDRYGNVEGGFFDYHPSVEERIHALLRVRSD